MPGIKDATAVVGIGQTPFAKQLPDSEKTLACRAIERMIIRGVRREWKPERAAATVSLDDLISGEGVSGPGGRFVDLVSAVSRAYGFISSRLSAKILIQYRAVFRCSKKNIVPPKF